MKYYSERLNKMFNSEADLHNAEKALVAKQADKQKQAIERKADAVKVEDAFKAMNVAKKAYSETVTKAAKAYDEAVKNAKLAYNNAIEGVEKNYTDAEDKYNSELKTFIAKNPSGYHLTLKDGNETAIISGSSSHDPVKIMSNSTNSLMKSFFDILDDFRLSF